MGLSIIDFTCLSENEDESCLEKNGHDTNKQRKTLKRIRNMDCRVAFDTNPGQKRLAIMLPCKPFPVPFVSKMFQIHMDIQRLFQTSHSI